MPSPAPLPLANADNERSKCFTVLDVEVGDYPGAPLPAEAAGQRNRGTAGARRAPSRPPATPAAATGPRHPEPAPLLSSLPGLLRVLSWCLNGLDVVAQNAVMRTSDDGNAHNTFWLTSRSGSKLSDAAADLLAERVRDFVM